MCTDYLLVIIMRPMNVTLSTIILIFEVFSFFGCSKPLDTSKSPKLVERAVELSEKRELTNELPDVLAATNIEQWKSFIVNLAKVPGLPNQWMTLNRQKGVDAVVIKSQGQSIVYKTAYVDLTVWNDAGDILEASIRTPKMDIVETRDLGLKICKMFDFNSKKFDDWCKSVGTEWLDTPVYYDGDSNQNHIIQIRHSYNKQQPWVMFFIIQPEPAHSEFMRKVDRQATLPRIR